MKRPSATLLLPLLLLGCEAATEPETEFVTPVLSIVSGNDQVGQPGEELAEPLVVQVADEKGKALKDQIVNFRVVEGGGDVFAGVALTNGDGIARERWTLGPSGPQRVEVRSVDSYTGEPLVFGVFVATFEVLDADGDGVPDDTDNCPAVSNPDQSDYDADGAGDACDVDDDGDGVPDNLDQCPQGDTGWSGSAEDHDGDGCRDAGEDPDDDNDTVPDPADACPKGVTNWSSNASTDNDGDGCRDDVEDPDDDNDGVADGLDNCVLVSNPDQADTDGDGIGDACDPSNDFVDVGFGNPRAENRRTGADCPTGDVCFDYLVYLPGTNAPASIEVYQTIGPCPSTLAPDADIFLAAVNADLSTLIELTGDPESVTICTWVDPRDLLAEVEETNRMEVDVRVADLVITRAEILPN